MVQLKFVSEHLCPKMSVFCLAYVIATEDLYDEQTVSYIYRGMKILVEYRIKPKMWRKQQIEGDMLQIIWWLAIFY